MVEKLFTGLVNTRLAELASRVCSLSQAGFPRGRSITEHVLHFEHAAAARALAHEDHPAAILLDIRVAFPSLDHSCIMLIWERYFGADSGVYRILSAMYAASHTKISILGRKGAPTSQ